MRQNESFLFTFVANRKEICCIHGIAKTPGGDSKKSTSNRIFRFDMQKIYR